MRTRFFILKTALAVAFCGGAPCGLMYAQAPEDAAVGFVDKIVGRWVAASGPDLRKDMLLKSGLTIRNTNPTSGEIQIIYFDRPPVSRKCSEAAPCNRSLQTPYVEDKQPGFVAFLSSFLTKPNPVPAVFVVARAVTVAPFPSIAEYSEGSLDIHPALASLVPGEYRFRLSSPPPLLQPAIELKTTSPEGRVPMKAPRPGIYSLTPIDADGNEVGSTAAIYVPAPTDVAAAKQTFAAALAEAKSWKGADESLVRSFATRVVLALGDHR